MLVSVVSGERVTPGLGLARVAAVGICVSRA